MSNNDRWNVSGVFGTNRYLWAMLQQELGWNPLSDSPISSTNPGLIPITVPQNQPEFDRYNKPFIVYNHTAVPTQRDNYLIRGEKIAYSIWSASERDIREAVSLMTYLFNRDDDSAQEINSWIARELEAQQDRGNVSASFAELARRIDYKNCRISEASGAEPATSEGGRMDGTLILTVMFTDDIYNGSLSN